MNVKETNEFLKNFKPKESVYRPRYHLSAKKGWINDPHGFNHFKGEFHIFFQYDPFYSTPHKVYWGHVTTTDFIHFSDTMVAIAPIDPYDNAGCFSGSTIVKDDTLYIFYTGHALKEDGKYYQTLNVAYSKDGYNFEKSNLNPLIDTKDIPSCADIYDFRDPCIFKKDDKYYIILGSKNRAIQTSLLLLFESNDLLHWNFKKVLVESNKLGSMFECPNLITFENENYIVVSPQDVPPKGDSFYNVSSCIYFKLPKDFINNDVTLENPKEIDHGFEYYAPNVYDPDKLLAGWHQLWGRRYYLAEIGEDFTNNFTLFKDIKREKSGVLRFIPLKSYENLYRNEEKHSFKIKPQKEKIFNVGKYYHAKIKVKTLDDLLFTIKITKNNNESVDLKLDAKNKTLVLDRTSLKEQLFGCENNPSTWGYRFLKLDEIKDEFSFEIYVDSECVEIFVNNYKDSFSLLSFSGGDDLSFLSNKETKVKFVKHDMIVD